jgi:uncharacterized membrane protein YqjE
MSDAKATGLFGSLKRLGDLTLATAQNRLQLFAVELQEEKIRFVQAIVLAAAAVALGAVALTLVTITVVVLCWDGGRVPALCVLSGLYIIATGAAVWLLKKKLAGAPAFNSTLSELEKDRACFLPEN